MKTSCRAGSWRTWLGSGCFTVLGYMMSRGAERTCFIYTWPTVGLGELLAGLVAEAVGKPFHAGAKASLVYGMWGRGGRGRIDGRDGGKNKIQDRGHFIFLLIKKCVFARTCA